MSMCFRGPRLSPWLWLLLVAACASAPPSQRPARTAPVARVAPPPVVKRADGLYSADEALRDALSGPLQYVGTGFWPGIARVSACVFRNTRVWVVNAYCTITETPAFRVDVFSPQRGRVRIYAESRGTPSTRARRDYFTFTVESEPPPGVNTGLAPLSMAMSFQELRAYDEKRYDAYLPACFGGQELYKKKEGCLGALAPRVREWAEQNHTFLEQASKDWYRLVRELRASAMRYGREPGD